MTTTGAEQMAISVLAFLAESSMRALALALVAGLGIVALRGRRASVQLWIWSVVLYGAMAMPLVTKVVPAVGLPFPAFALSGPSGQAESGGGVVISNRPSSVLLAQPGATTRKVALEPITIAFGIYLIGVAVLLLRAAVGWMMTRRLERTAAPVDAAEMLARLSRHAAAAGVRRQPRLAESTQLLVPVTTSVRHPMIALPVSWREWSTAKIDAVLAHEMAHIARHDTLTQRISLIYRAAFWPNPFSWWLHRRIAALAEQVSDEAALDAGIDRTTYAETLVGFFAEHSRDGGRRAVWHVAMARGGSASAEERVERVLAWHRGGSAAVTKTMAVGIVLAAAPMMVLASALRPEPATPAIELPAPPAVLRPAPVNDPRPLALPRQETVYQPGNGVKVPVPIKRDDPKYTDAARLAGIQGNVELDIVVLANGTVGDVRVTKSLEAGLDAQAILSAKQWLFKPAMKDGSPVAMIVGLVVEFKLPQVPASAPVVLPGVLDGHGKEFYFFNYPNGQANAQGLVPPKPIKQVTPKYTSDALRAKIQGDVEVEIIVLTDGTVGDVRVTKSLDAGLDEQAIAAARQWRFQPATKDGQPVEYTATLSLEFRVHDGPPAPAAVEPYAPDTPGLIAPKVIKWGTPKYTSDAMRAKIFGTVELDVVVQADGTIGEIRITKSLDTKFGLDQEAIAAAKGYTFTAATLNGAPVAAIVKLMIEFRLH